MNAAARKIKNGLLATDGMHSSEEYVSGSRCRSGREHKIRFQPVLLRQWHASSAHTLSRAEVAGTQGAVPAQGIACSAGSEYRHFPPTVRTGPCAATVGSYGRCTPNQSLQPTSGSSLR